MTSSWTPGPWRLSEENNVWSENGQRIANVIDPSNALLISLAPQLAEALRGLIFQFEQFDPGDDDGVSECKSLREARALLSQLEGGR